MIKNLLHFAQVRTATAEEKGDQPSDSGNGYYSYDYYVLPFSGKVDQNAIGRISTILHNRHYRYPFTSLGYGPRVIKTTETGGELLYSVTYHHGD